MLPEDFDVLSFREILLVIRADGDVNRESWRRAATISTFMYNYGTQKKRGFAPKHPRFFFPHLFKRIIENFEKRYQAAVEQEAVYLEQVAKKAARLEREKSEE